MDILVTVFSTQSKSKRMVNINCNYKYVYSILDKVTNGIDKMLESIDRSNLVIYLRYHQSNILNINSKITKNKTGEDLIDALMIFFSGHGNKQNLILGNGEKLSYDRLKDMFDNLNCEALCAKPKLFFLDC